MEKDYRDVIRSVFVSRDDQDFIERWVGCAAEAPDFLKQCRAYVKGVRTKSEEEVQEILDTVNPVFVQRLLYLRGLNTTLSLKSLGEQRNAILRQEVDERLRTCLTSVREAMSREEINEAGFFEQVEDWLQRQRPLRDYCKVADVLKNRREAFIKGVMWLSEALHSESLNQYLSVLMENLFSHHARVVSFAVILAADAGDERRRQTTDGIQEQLKKCLKGWPMGSATMRSHVRGALAVLGIIEDAAGRHQQQVTFLPGGKAFLGELLTKFEAAEREAAKHLPNECEYRTGQQSLDFFEGV